MSGLLASQQKFPAYSKFFTVDTKVSTSIPTENMWCILNRQSGASLTLVGLFFLINKDKIGPSLATCNLPF